MQVSTASCTFTQLRGHRWQAGLPGLLGSTSLRRAEPGSSLLVEGKLQVLLHFSEGFCSSQTACGKGILPVKVHACVGLCVGVCTLVGSHMERVFPSRRHRRHADTLSLRVLLSLQCKARESV